MLDAASQQRFTRGCTEASVGYATAATAAYTQMASEALDFWCTAFSGFSGDVPAAGSKAPVPPADTAPAAEVPFGLSPDDWSPFPWFDPRRYEAMMSLDTRSPPPVAFMAMANAVPLRGSSTAWPFAHAMIESGMPRTVAWPAAEANAAALDAADAASSGFRQIVASFHTESGYASVVRSLTPSIGAMMLTAGMLTSPLGGSLGWPWIAA